MKPTSVRWLLLLAVALPFAGRSAPSRPAPLIAHEWGTFTSLQDEAGEAIGGINTEDEPAPPFVHRLADYLLLRPTEVPPIFFQGAPRCHPDVTLRLETPVLYFHPPPNQPLPLTVSVTAAFRGGWLSEFYPDADANASGLESHGMVFGPLRSNTVSALAWNNLEVGGDWNGPATTQRVWTSPRAVRAAPVRTPGGEAERFLFYRGVARIDAPMAVMQDAKAGALALRSQCPPEIAGREPLKVNSLWLVDIRENGRLAFRVAPPVVLEGEDKLLTRISNQFAPRDYSEANREKLKASLHDALVAEGLFDDEAGALLSTWELSYFKSAGRRLFFLAPRAWTDFYLPLRVSPPAEVTRVMVGRIELVTPEQRNYLRRIAGIPANETAADAKRFWDEYLDRIGKAPGELREVSQGQRSLAAYGLSVPKSYQWYLALGRFRNALILDEARKRPAPGLDSFISTYRLAGYQPVPGRGPSAESAAFSPR